MASITIHRLYYGPVGENGWLLKSSRQVQNGKILSSDQILDIYTKEPKSAQTVDDSELLYTANGPVIRVSRVKPLQGHDKRTMDGCNNTLLVPLSEISNLLLPLLDQPLDFPIQEITLNVVQDGSEARKPNEESTGNSSSSTA